MQKAVGTTEISARSSIVGLTFSYFTFSSVRLILYEIRLGDCIDSFSSVQLNATPRNSHPLSWDGTMLLWVNLQGFNEGDRLAGMNRGGNQRCSSRVFLMPCLCAHPPRNRTQQCTVDHYKQGPTKQRLPHCNNAALWWYCPLGSARQRSILRKKRAQAELHMLGEPDDFCALVSFFHGADGSGQVFKIMLHLKAHGHFALLTLWGHFDENTHFVGLSEGYNAMEGNKHSIRQVTGQPSQLDSQSFYGPQEISDDKIWPESRLSTMKSFFSKMPISLFYYQSKIQS